ncbi:MAG: hypothetical protein H0Z29_10620 [Candidatus Marinimicrobia bacterium]|nr:hypothetical protein [Candidatus Neomarinimicrobiota bacterium]
MIKKIVVIIFIPILLASLYGANPALSGYIEGRYFVLINRDNDSYQSLWSRAVIDIDARVNQNAKLFIRIRGEETSGFLNKISLIGSSKKGVSFDRFYFDLNRQNLRLRVGKQIISWSFGYIFRPMDVFMPVSVYEPTFDFSGINSIKLSARTGRLSQFDAVMVPEEGYKNSKFAFRLITNIAEADLLLNYSHYKVGDFLGLALKRDMGIGVWIESIYFIDSDIDRYKNNFNTLVGFDYTFPVGNGLYFLTEYNHDQTGFESDNYSFKSAIAEERKFLGRNYLFSMINYPLNNKYSISVFCVSNLDDKSTIFSPSLSYNPRINITVNFGAYFNFSKDGTEFAPNILSKSYRGAHYLYIFIKTYF